MNALQKAILGLCLAVLFIPAILSADGMMLTPPNYWARETDQKAVIFYDQGIETMVISIRFEGNAKDFGWIIPVPDKPIVTKGSQKLFSALQKLTQARPPTTYGLLDMSQGLSGARGPVTIVEEKTIEYYDVKVLTSTDKEALAKWFKDNNFSFPEASSYVLDSYINNNWYFVAMKINPESLQSQTVNQELKSGTATPVAMSFKAKNLVYPLKISSVVTGDPIIIDDHGTPGNWEGCRGTGLNVCIEAVKNIVGSNQEVEKYFGEHPDCIKNDTCGGVFLTCNAKCPQPGQAFVAPSKAQSPQYYRPSYVSAGILLYIFADHKKEVSDFSTLYANWLGKKDVEKLATNDQGDPWIQPKKGKYFLTTLYRSMSYSQMTEDLFPQNAKDNKKIVPDQEESPNKPLLSFLSIIILLSLVFLSPPAVIFAACALIQFLSNNKVGHIIAWIVQGIILCFYCLIFLWSLNFLVQPIARTIEYHQQWTGVLTSINNGGLLNNINSFFLLLPIFISLAIIGIIITIIYQIRSQLNKKSLADAISPSQKKYT